MSEQEHVPEAGMPVEELERLRTDLEQMREDQLRVEHRKVTLIQVVKDKIADLQQLLVQYGEPATPAPDSRTGTRPSHPVIHRLPAPATDKVSIIERVRRELTRLGTEVDTAVLRQTLIERDGVAPTRLKNLSQILYNSTSVYKAGGKIGLAAWKVRKTPAKGMAKTPPVNPALKAPKGAKTASKVV